MKREYSDRRHSPEDESKPRKMVKVEEKADTNGLKNGTTHP